MLPVRSDLAPLLVRRSGRSARRERWRLVAIPWQGPWRRGASALGRLGLCAALVGGWLPGGGLLSAGLSAAGVLAGVQAAPPALAQGAGLPSAEAVGTVARGITVRIEGATQGSGVLVQREGDTYTVLTAWHVVSAQGPGEELAVYTPDGRDHAVLAGSIRRIGAVDLAELRFRSSTAYAVAQLAPLATAPMGSLVYVAGFPHPSSAVPRRLLRFLEGRVVADAGADIPNGYQLLYDNKTLPGMSGGAVLNGRGQLVAIHGQGETEVRLTEQADVAVKTGTNQGVPVAFWREPGGTAATRESVRQPERETPREREPLREIPAQPEREVRRDPGIRTSIRSQAGQPFAQGVSIQAPQSLTAKTSGDPPSTLKESQAQKYIASGRNRADKGDYIGAILEYTTALVLDPSSVRALLWRAWAKIQMGAPRDAVPDVSQVLSANPQNAMAFYIRAVALLAAGNGQESCRDLAISRSLDPNIPNFAHMDFESCQ